MDTAQTSTTAGYDWRAPLAAWLLTAGAAAAAVVAWGNGTGWQLGHLTVFGVFPIFGLLAFSVMWAQTVSGALAGWRGTPPAALHEYYQATGWLVLIAIVLHPGLLMWQLWRDGFGLPPDSYLQHYVAPSLRWAAVLGSCCLLIFLAYELHRWLGDRGWWHYVTHLVDAAMLGIFYHGLRLGTQTQAGWFHVLWLFYGVSLAVALIWKYAGLFRQRTRHA